MSARTTTAAKTAPIALHAVAQHMLDHQLLARGLDAPGTLLDDGAVIIHADRPDADAWLDTMTIDDERTRPSECLPDREHVTYEGRITTAIGDVRVQLRTIRKRIPLQLVAAGAEVSS